MCAKHKRFSEAMASFNKKPIFVAMKLRLQNSWMFIAFFVSFFLFWEYAVVWFDIPRYILTPPSLIVERVQQTSIGCFITPMSPDLKSL